MSRKHEIWQDMMIASINEGLERGLITLDPDQEVDMAVCRYVREGTSYLVRFHSIGWGEVSVCVNADPVDDEAALAYHWGGALRDRSASALGWLERKTGAYLMKSDKPLIRLTKRFNPPTQKAVPKGYAPSGKFYL